MFTSVASVYYQAREELLRNSQRPAIAASSSNHPVPLPPSTAEVDTLPITQTLLPNPAHRSLYGSSMNLKDIPEIDLGDPREPSVVLSFMNLKQDIPEIDLGDPREPIAVQPVKTESYVLIDMSHLEEPTQPWSSETASCSSVFSFIKGLFTLY